MDMLDNTPRNWAFQREMLKKAAILSLCSGLALIGIACEKASPATYTHVPVRSAAEAIAEADRLYTDRTDLGKGRQGLVSLRQAKADDNSNYELAWRLSNFNYTLGSPLA